MQTNRLAFKKLDTYLVAKEIAKLVHLAKIRDSELRDQATRASKGCFRQLCWGLPNEGVAMRRTLVDGRGRWSRSRSCSSSRSFVLSAPAAP